MTTRTQSQPAIMKRRFWTGIVDRAKGVIGELRKVVWPSRQETLQTTLAVFLFVTVAGVFFWLLDAILAWLTKLLTGQGG